MINKFQENEEKPIDRAPRLVPPVEEGTTSTAMESELADTVPWSKIFKYLFIVVGSVFLLLVLVDKVVMPWYVKLGAVQVVPNVVGEPFDSARKQLESIGFEIRKGEPRHDDHYPAGTVVQQLPYGGAETKEGRRIYLTVSLGTEMIPMPDMLGMQLREARITLMRLGLDVGQVDYEYNDTIMRDLIFMQSIPPKVGARPGSSVDVVISRGPSTRYTMMPNLVSLDVEQARVRLENAGLVLGVVRFKPDAAYAKNTVIEQSISPYSQVAEKSAVDVTVATDSASLQPEIKSDEEQQGGPVVKNLDDDQ
jgi:serine/threonine-protein kinase